MFIVPVLEEPVAGNVMGPPLADCQRVDELWFKDGTLVLLTEQSLFCVYGGLLATSSPVFQDMFGFPQPDNAEVINDCPVVRLEDDAQDLTYFLKALFDYEFFKPFPEETTFDVIAGVIRVSTKYQGDALRKRALGHLCATFSFTAAELYTGTRSWQIPSNEWIHVVLFAREMSLDWILPVAFYRMVANCTPAELQNGTDISGVHMELGPHDKIICLEQCLEFTRSACSEIVQFLWEPLQIPGCTANIRSWNCTKSRIAARQKMEHWRRKKIFPMKLWLPGDWDGLNVCGNCMSAMKAAHQEALDTFWEGLPQRFGLPGWEALRQMKERDFA